MKQYISGDDNPLVQVLFAKAKEIEELKKEIETLKAAIAVAEQQIRILNGNLIAEKDNYEKLYNTYCDEHDYARKIKLKDEVKK